MNSKIGILRILENNLSQAEDNLCIVIQQFKRMTPEQLNTEYGESGQTCSSILRDYRAAVALAKNCLADIDL